MFDNTGHLKETFSSGIQVIEVNKHEIFSTERTLSDLHPLCMANLASVDQKLKYAVPKDRRHNQKLIW